MSSREYHCPRDRRTVLIGVGRLLKIGKRSCTRGYPLATSTTLASARKPRLLGKRLNESDSDGGHCRGNLLQTTVTQAYFPSWASSTTPSLCPAEQVPIERIPSVPKSAAECRICPRVTRGPRA